MRSFAYLEIVIFCALVAIVKGIPISDVTRDERQEGQTNVQVDLKDVKILALLDSDLFDDYLQYDYAYDYADFTIKPKPPSSSSTAQTTTTLNSLTTSSPIANVVSTELPTSTEKITPEITSNSLNQILTSSSSGTTLMNESTAALINVSSTTSSSSTLLPIQSADRRAKIESTNRKRCPMGYLLKSGRCFKRRMPIISPRLALMKLVPALVKSVEHQQQQQNI